MTKTIHPWTEDRPVSSPFALPEGLVGFLAGRLMLLGHTDQEVLDLLDLQPHHRVLEVGFGAGGLLGRLADAGASFVAGVDPSTRMLRDATSRNAAAIDSGRMTLAYGTASATGRAPGEFQRVVSVHNVALWPDLEEGIRELRRVTSDDGLLLIAWHGGRNPPWTTRGLRLPPNKLDRIEATLAAHFESVERHERSRDEVFIARPR